MIPGQSNSLDPINKTGPERQKAMFDAFVIALGVITISVSLGCMLGWIQRRR